MSITQMRQGMFAVHVGAIVLVAVSALLFLAGGDESLAGGALLLLLVAAGLPWTLVPLLALDIDGNFEATITYAGLALMNAVILHTWWGRRSGVHGHGG